MRRLSWCDSTTAAVSPRVRVERFCGKSRHRVHLLGEVRCKKTHYRFGENTMPCLEPEACPFCADPLWKPRLEFFGPALVMNTKEKLWVPIVAVFTQGGFNKLRSAPPGPHRGRLLDVFRQAQGTAGGGILVVKELSRIDPIVPAFDIEPHLLRLWFPLDAGLPPAEIPSPVPFTEEAPAPRPEPEPSTFTPEARELLRAHVAKLRGEMKPSGEPVSPPPVVPAKPKPSITPDEEKVQEALRRRVALRKQPEELTVAEAVDFGRITDYVIAGAKAPAIANGKKGGAK